MTSKTKNILIILSVLVVIGLGVVGYGAYKIYSLFTHFGSNREVPPELQQARITVGEGFLTRTEFFKLEEGGVLKAIGEGSRIPDEKEREKKVNANVARGIYNFADLQVVGQEIIAVAEFGGFFFDVTGNLKKEIYFEPVAEKLTIGPYEHQSYQSRASNLRIVRLDSSKVGFLSFDSTQGVLVFDENGNQIWSHGKKDVDLASLVKDPEAEYEKSTHVMQAAVGDLDGDGVSEYVVARKNDGLRAYDKSGKERWFQPDEFPSTKLDIIDLDGDGKAEVIEIGERIRDGNGKIIRETKGSDSDAYLVVEAKDGKAELQFASFYEGDFTYSSENGEKLFNTHAPLSSIKKKPENVDVPGNADIDDESVAFPKAAWVGFRKNEPKLLAVIASFILLPRSNFYVFDKTGRLIYHELLPEKAETLTILPTTDGEEDILIGGKNTIWRYSAN